MSEAAEVIDLFPGQVKARLYMIYFTTLLQKRYTGQRLYPANISI